MKNKLELYCLNQEIGFEVKDFEQAVNEIASAQKTNKKEFYLLLKNQKLIYSFEFDGTYLKWVNHL